MRIGEIRSLNENPDTTWYVSELWLPSCLYVTVYVCSVGGVVDTRDDQTVTIKVTIDTPA